MTALMSISNLQPQDLPCGLERLSVDLSTFTPQRPYRNGVTVYRKSLWGGNGFGTDHSMIAIQNGQVVAVYDTRRTSRTALVAGHPEPITADYIRYRGENLVARTARNKWIELVKGLS